MRFGIVLFALCLLVAAQLHAQQITLQPQQGKMNCAVRVPGLRGQAFVLGLPETIGSSEGSILNFPETSVQWTGPDPNGAVHSEWTSDRKIEYELTVTPFTDYVDVEMTIRNLSRTNWTNVFSFNCLNPTGAPDFKDWNLERTYMSKNGQPFRMDGTTRINDGAMSTVQFYVTKGVTPVSPFVNGFKATSPDQTDDSYIVTLSEDGASYMAATSPKSCFLFDNLDRCCIHSATNFGDIASGEAQTVTSRFYFAKGTLDDFLNRFSGTPPVSESSDARVLMCYGNPWVLTDTTQWQYVYENIDILKFYIGNIDSRIPEEQKKSFVASLLSQDIKIAIELGGLLDWHASKGDQVAEASFQQDYNNVKPLINLIKEIDPNRNIDMLDMDGPIRRMLFPQNVEQNYHTIESAVDELFEVVKMWRDSIPGIEINLLTNFPNWAWGSTPAYVQKAGKSTGYGQYMDVLSAVRKKSAETGINLSAITIDNPYNYAIGAANSNQPAVIQGVDWMQRIADCADTAKSMGLDVNMIFNTNSGRDAQGYSEQSLELIDLYHEKVGQPDGYWIQSWYQLPGEWLPETTPYTMTNLTMEAMKKIRGKPTATTDLPYWGLRNIDMKLPDNVYQDWNPQYIAWGFVWDRLERPDDTFNWTYIDGAVDFTAQYGAKAIWLLTPASSWASSGEPRAPDDLDRSMPIDAAPPAEGYSVSLYDYVYKIIDRIAKRNPDVLGYLRYGNEPQYPDHWTTTEQTYKQDVEDYIRCLRTAYIAAHKAAADNNAEIEVSHGGFYYYSQIERIWFEYGEANPASQDSLLNLFNSHFERQWPKPITTWDNFKRRQESRSGIPPAYWMDAIAGQTDWLDWFDIHYHFKPRYIFDDMRAFEKAVIDSGGTLKPWLAAEAAMQIEELGETDYEERFHAGDMVRKWISGLAAGLEAICTPVVGAPPDRFFGLYSDRGNRYMSADAYAFVHSLIAPSEMPEILSSSDVVAYRFNEEKITDVIWQDALFDWMSDYKAFSLTVPVKYTDRLPGELKAKHYDVLGTLVETYSVDEANLDLSVSQEPIIIVWEYKIVPSGGELAKYEPPDGYVYHGVGWNYRNSVPLYLQMMPEDQQPLMLQTMSAIPGTRGMTTANVYQGLNQSWKDPDKQFVEYGVHFHITQDEPQDSIFAYTSDLDHYIDTLEIGFKQHGKPFFLRIGGEMNGAWNNYTPYAYPAAFRKLVLELRSRGVDNFATIWCYEPAAPEDYADSTSRGWKWYPGDDVVDWFGIDVFPARDFDPNEPDTSRNGQRTPKAKSETFLKFARDKGKPVYIAETTAHSEHIIPDAQDPNLNEGEKIWNHWFVPYFQFLDNHPEIKAFNYINLDWTPISKWSHWGDARLEINTYIREHWIAELSKPKYIHKGFDLGNPVLNVEHDFHQIPRSTLLYQNYPNPFNPSTVIPYRVPKAGNVRISVYDIRGTEVVELINQHHESGEYIIRFDAGHLSAGMYICRMQADSRIYSIKTILAK